MAALQKRENKMRRTLQEKRKMRGRHFRRKKDKRTWEKGE